MNLGMQQGGGFMSAASASNQAQFASQQAAKAQNPAESPAGEWTCVCGAKNSGKFCSECGKPKPVLGEWVCSCGAKNSGKFCSECGKPKPTGSVCPNCGFKFESVMKFCPECGTKLG